jgi:hypothetical protein
MPKQTFERTDPIERFMSSVGLTPKFSCGRSLLCCNATFGRRLLGRVPAVVRADPSDDRREIDLARGGYDKRRAVAEGPESRVGREPRRDLRLCLVAIKVPRVPAARQEPCGRNLCRADAVHLERWPGQGAEPLGRRSGAPRPTRVAPPGDNARSSLSLRRLPEVHIRLAAQYSAPGAVTDSARGEERLQQVVLVHHGQPESCGEAPRERRLSRRREPGDDEVSHDDAAA